jgi:hypothetical protein
MRKLLHTSLLAAALLLSLGGGVLFTGRPATANNGANGNEPSVSLSVSPAQQRLDTLNPGDTVTAETIIINSGTEGYDVKVYATPYEIADDYSHNIFDRESTYSQLYRWVTFNDPTEFYLEPGARRTVRFTVTVPASVPAGGQYASVMAETVPPADATGVIAVRRIASLLYANIAGDTKTGGEITGRTWRDSCPTDLTPTPNDAKQNTPCSSNRDILTTLTIKNTGNTDFSAENRLIVHNIFGKQIDEVVEASKMIFPETSRTFGLNWRSTRAVGVFRLTQQSTFLNQTIEESKWIFILPVWFIITIVAVLAAVVIAVVFFIKRRQSRRRGRRYAD